jgi:hypothetical protein
MESLASTSLWQFITRPSWSDLEWYEKSNPEPGDKSFRIHNTVAVYCFHYVFDFLDDCLVNLIVYFQKNEVICEKECRQCAMAEILEGFLCPLCMKDLGDVIQLQVKFTQIKNPCRQCIQLGSETPTWNSHTIPTSLGFKGIVAQNRIRMI